MEDSGPRGARRWRRPNPRIQLAVALLLAAVHQWTAPMAAAAAAAAAAAGGARPAAFVRPSSCPASRALGLAHQVRPHACVLSASARPPPPRTHFSSTQSHKAGASPPPVHGHEQEPVPATTIVADPAPHGERGAAGIEKCGSRVRLLRPSAGAFLFLYQQQQGNRNAPE